MYYELWETASGNRIGAYETVAAALEVVGRSVQAYGDTYAESWLLAAEDEAGAGELIAEGSELVHLAKQRMTAA